MREIPKHTSTMDHGNIMAYTIIDRRNPKAYIHYRSKKHYDMPFMIDEGIAKAHIHGGSRKHLHIYP